MTGPRGPAGPWWGHLDRRAIAVGAAASMAVALPAALVAEAVVDDGSSLGLPLFVLVLIGFGLGGFVAARRGPRAPLSNGAVAALAVYVIIQGVGAIRRAVVDDPVSLPAVVFAALMACSTGLLGALLATRTARR